jgi:hypothetical protein
MIIAPFIIAIILASPSFADDTPDLKEWRGGPHVGISLYTGVVGAEIQKGHYGVTLGLPTCIGIKYYPDERGYRWFFGIHTMKYSTDNKESIDNITYDRRRVTNTGAGFGYRWRWFNHLDLTTSLSVTYLNEELTGQFAKRTEKSYLLYPGITIGYTF